MKFPIRASKHITHTLSIYYYGITQEVLVSIIIRLKVKFILLMSKCIYFFYCVFHKHKIVNIAKLIDNSFTEAQAKNDIPLISPSLCDYVICPGVLQCSRAFSSSHSPTSRLTCMPVIFYRFFSPSVTRSAFFSNGNTY